MKFTDVYLKTLKPQEKEYQRSEPNGLALRILPSGVRRWEFIYVSPLTCKRRRMHLGNYSEAGAPHKPEFNVTLEKAHEAHREAYGLFLKGLDPQAPPEPEPAKTVDHTKKVTTVSMLINRYTASIEGFLCERSVKHHKSRLKNHILKALGADRDIKTIEREEALDIIEAIADTEKKPGAARNAASSASAAFAYAVKRGMLIYNPFFQATNVIHSAQPKKKERFLIEDEIKHLLGQIKQIKGEYNRFNEVIKLLLYTGQRPNEIAGMEWIELESDTKNPRKTDRWLLIPQERSRKNKQDILVYLTSPVRRVLRNARSINEALTDSKYVFPASRGSKAPTLVTSLDAFVEKRVGGTPLAGLPKWEPHDLRRTFATHLSRIGCPFWITDLLQDHKLAGQTVADDHLISQVMDNYNLHKFEAQRREWAIRWAWEIRRILRSNK